jgi:hypothetical protein
MTLIQLLVYFRPFVWALLWGVDPGGDWLCWRYWLPFDEPLWVSFERVVQRDLTGGVDLVDLSVMDLVWRH